MTTTTDHHARLKTLARCGQSYWLDDLNRTMIESGELAKRVQEQSLRGVTSNPKTFMKAIVDGSDYDQLIREQAISRNSPRDTYDRIIVRDVRDACGILRPVYEETDGAEGYVSLEISPHLAYDPRRTEEEAVRYFESVGCPNLMIKVPGTPEGVPAIENLIARGVNVNVTPLFSISAYEAVALAYIRGMERRARNGQRLDSIASVASFFLSRIDVLVDRLLAHRPDSEEETGTRQRLRGRAAIASAKIVYQRFLAIFSTREWQDLESRGARKQRPLWASTGNKNPEYDELRYVEPLIGRDSVTTMPSETIEAFRESGNVQSDTVVANVGSALETLEDLETIEIPLHCVTWELEHEGVQKFIDPFDAILGNIEKVQQGA